MALAFVQSASVKQDNTAAGDYGLEFPVPAGGFGLGSLIVALISGAQARLIQAATPATDDSGGSNTYVLDKSLNNGTAVAVSVVSCYLTTALTSAHTITFTFDGTGPVNAPDNRGCIIAEFTGVANTSYVDQSSNLSASAISNVVTSTAVTTAQANEIVISGWAINAGAAADIDADPTPYITLDQTNNNSVGSANNKTIDGVYQLVTAATSYQPVAHVGVASSGYANAVVTYKEAAVVVTPPKLRVVQSNLRFR